MKYILYPLLFLICLIRILINILIYLIIWISVALWKFKFKKTYLTFTWDYYMREVWDLLFFSEYNPIQTFKRYLSYF